MRRILFGLLLSLLALPAFADEINDFLGVTPLCAGTSR